MIRNGNLCGWAFLSLTYALVIAIFADDGRFVVTIPKLI